MPAFKSARAYRDFARYVTVLNRYVMDAGAQDFLETLLREGKTRIELILAGSPFWRAQLGHDLAPLLDAEGRQYDVELLPHSQVRMKPLRDRAREGRANPKGIPYLYLSTHRDTALAEVRPWLGSLVSVAQFKVLRELRIVNCTSDKHPRLFYIGDIPPEKWDEMVWADIDQAFSRPVTPSDDSSEYVPTQIITEFFKAHDFDGVAYRSSLGAGHNLVLFDLDAAELVNCSLYELKDLRFDFRECANPYFVQKHPQEDTGVG